MALAGAFWYRSVLVQVMTGLAFNAMPLAIEAAILRYRLYDINRIASRTLAWALLTLVLGLGYAGVVLGLGRLLPDSSSLAVAAATLAAAAVVQPVRRRIQGAVDRRFNRRRYDAARTIQGFSGRLREEVDLDVLTGELLAVVEETVQQERGDQRRTRLVPGHGGGDDGNDPGDPPTRNSRSPVAASSQRA